MRTHMRADFIEDGWEYDAPDTKNVKEAHLDGLDFRYEYEYSGADRAITPWIGIADAVSFGADD